MKKERKALDFYFGQAQGLFFLILWLGLLSFAPTLRAQTRDSLLRLQVSGLTPDLLSRFKAEYRQKKRFEIRKDTLWLLFEPKNFTQEEGDSIALYYDSLCKTEQKKIDFFLQQQGFFTPRYRFLKERQRQYELQISLGSPFFWGEIEINLLPESLQQEIRKKFQQDFYFTKNKDTKKVFSNSKKIRLSLKQWRNLQDWLLEKAQNGGYPFAQTWADSIRLSPPHSPLSDSLAYAVHLRLRFVAGTQIYFDSLILRGDAKLKQRFMQRYLGIEKGKLYEEKAIQNITEKIKYLPYLRLKKAPEVLFKSDKAYTILYLEAEKSNQIDGFIGFLPNQNLAANTPNSPTRTLLTGQATLHLQNPFGDGKALFFHWQRFRPQAQTLKTHYTHPDFFNSGIEIVAGLELLQQDSAFSTLTRRLALGYPATWGKGYVFYHQRNATGLPQRNALPDNLNNLSNQFSQFGVGYTWQNLDNAFFPKKGWLLKAEIGVGNKRVSRDTTLASLDLYENIALLSIQWQGEGELQFFQPLGRGGTLLLAAKGAFLENPYLFPTDLLRLGGLQNLRGFNENSFFVRHYAQFVSEYRLYFESKSYLFAFFEASRLQTNIGNESPLAFGGGLTFQTRAGIFHFIYAMGKSQFQSLGLSQAKIHFGLKSAF
ncbi:BamA/TamA family outer membrane protein [Hugenholtzia roseola]|uniref:BamA/TamA family outer membrane protein n=1 Tax=Hugenholtzia roseola TaxID=1002 RepID=UPI00047BC5EA|nr:BamA/TamA family outer membrane protein [Hugenholtzia roseola]